MSRESNASSKKVAYVTDYTKRKVQSDKESLASIENRLSDFVLMSCDCEVTRSKIFEDVNKLRRARIALQIEVSDLRNRLYVQDMK